MLASKPALAPAFTVAAEGRREGEYWPTMLAALGICLCAIGWLYYGNTRLWGSWHGFVHAGIASRFSDAAFPPENPFFAGERLPYYWAYHFVGYWLSRASRLDLLHTFHAISWIS